ncbi:hypothetical protein MTR62_06585 [Novosphingobium sp. 1949]|uniref:Zinc-finger domain-containing protein n=1 Tax=Novosphingobium organovorum TaxID=2930092 RepID=A0ABT0BC19_9SPHN|nr:hypothetical protein [Novosphingobium organovorum]MCJ2182369.1 hypothetical protein [Novosphingobium organovorum]
MTGVTREELRAYADGELSGEAADRIEEAVAHDPELAAQLQAEQRLRARLQAHFDPVAEEAVPDALMAMIAAAQEEDAAKAPAKEPHTPGAVAVPPVAQPSAQPPAPVLDFAAAKARREKERKEKAKARARAGAQRVPGQKGVPLFARPGLAAGLAASLVLGVMLGTSLNLGRFASPSHDAVGDSASVVDRGGQLVAAGNLARGLDTQLASAQGNGGPLRILTSFERDNGTYCRVYSARATAGIACRDGDSWVLERTQANQPSAASPDAYRQAGSAEADLMRAAQDMANGAPLDADGERTARKKGWK